MAPTCSDRLPTKPWKVFQIFYFINLGWREVIVITIIGRFLRRSYDTGFVALFICAQRKSSD